MLHQKCLTQTIDLSKRHSASAGVSFRNTKEPAGISGLFCIGIDPPGGLELSDLGAEERVEWRSELRLDSDVALCGVVDDDQDLLEERLVEHSLDVIGRCVVSLTAAFGQLEREVQVALDRVEVGVGRGQLDGDVLKRLGDAFLLAPEQVDGDRSGVVGFHELVALALQLVLLPFQGALLVLDFGSCVLQSFADHGFDSGAELGVERDALIVARDLLLDFVDQHRLL